MRSTLPLALVLLVLAAVLRLVTVFGPTGESARGYDQATAILATSRGAMLPEVPLPGGNELAPDTIAVGDLLLKWPGAGPGLRVVVLHPDLSLKSFEILDLARTPERVDKLESLALHGEQGAAIVLAVQGSVRPESGDTAALDEAVRRLGARVTPFRAPTASWALIAVRSGSTWRAVAEAYSETESVSLTATIENRPDTRARHTPGELVYAKARGGQSLDLSTPGQEPSVQSDHARLNKWAGVGDTLRSAFRLPSGGSTGIGHVVWNRVALGLDPRLDVFLGVSPESLDGFDGAECQVLVDGELAGSTELRATDDLEHWTPWSVDLAAHAGRAVQLELRVLPLEFDSTEPARQNWILWGEPTIHWEALP